MQFLKRNWLHMMSLGLSAILLLLLLDQKNEVARLGIKLSDDMNTPHEYTTCTVQQVASYTLMPVEIDSKRHAIQLKVSIALTQLDQNATVRLVYCLGTDLLGTPLQKASDGLFSGNIMLPVDREPTVKIMVTVDTKEGRWGEELYDGAIAELLPIRLGTCSGDTIYNGGTLYQTEWGVDFFEAVFSPEFLIYKNGKLLQRNPCHPKFDNAKAYWDSMDSYAVDCDTGDNVELRLACKDSFGLTYEFSIKRWKITESSAVALNTTSSHPTITWPNE